MVDNRHPGCRSGRLDHRVPFWGADEKQTIVNFSHYNWTRTDEFLAHCSTKWGVFMMSIKSCIETGKGQPYPRDVHIDFDE